MFLDIDLYASGLKRPWVQHLWLKVLKVRCIALERKIGGIIVHRDAHV